MSRPQNNLAWIHARHDCWSYLGKQPSPSKLLRCLNRSSICQRTRYSSRTSHVSRTFWLTVVNTRTNAANFRASSSTCFCLLRAFCRIFSCARAVATAFLRMAHNLPVYLLPACRKDTAHSRAPRLGNLLSSLRASNAFPSAVFNGKLKLFHRTNTSPPASLTVAAPGPLL